MQRQFIRRLGAIGVAALAIRIVYLVALRDDPLVTIPIGDGWQYDRWAQRIAAGEWSSPQAFYQAPLYPYLLAIIYGAVGHSLTAVRAFQAILGAASCVLLSVAGRGFFNERVGLLSAGLLAVYPFAIFSDGIIQKSSVDAFLVTAMLASLAVFMARPRWRWLIAAGLAAGAFAINRETGRLLYPIVVAWLVAYFHDQPIRTRLAWSAVFTAALAAVLAPVAVHNYLASGELLLSTSQAGPNFYIGNNPAASGIYEPLTPGGGSAERERDDAVRLAEEAAGRALSPGDVSRYWFNRSFEYIRTQPGPWLRLTGRKILLTFNAAEVSDTESLDVYAEHSRVLAILAWFDFGIVLPLAVFGLWQSRARWQALAVLYAALIVMTLSVAAFFVLGRYRYPAVPVFLLFAACGVDAAVRLRREGWRGGAVGLGLAAGALVLAHLPLTAAYRDTTLFNVGMGYLKADREAEAIPWLQQAVQRAPDDAAAHFALGVTYNRLGQPEPAVDALRTAGRLRPDDPETRDALAVALRNTGTVLSERGEHAQAIAAFRESLAVRPDDPATLNNLALALYAVGRPGDAIGELQTAVRLKPDYADAHANLALILEDAGDIAGAKAHFETALRLQPDHAGFKEAYAAFVRRHPGLGLS